MIYKLIEPNGNVIAKMYPHEIAGEVWWMMNWRTTSMYSISSECFRTPESGKRYAKKWIAYALNSKWKKIY